MNISKVPVIHQTDLFHSHIDPDDHWDLASQFALAFGGDIDLRGVLIDYPPKVTDLGFVCGDPAISAVNQLNFISGLSVPVAVGNETKVTCDEDVVKVSSMKPLNSGIAMIFRILEEAKEPVAIHIVGSSREIAVASMMRPDLFKEKCKSVYLNAGSAVENQMEYNVTIDPYSYSKMFKLPCPLYWMPCWHELEANKAPAVNTHGTYWRFNQGEILPFLSQQMQRFFAYALGKVTDDRWLSYLKYPLNKDTIEMQSTMRREMWCTAGFLHAAGKTVTADGEIVPIGTPEINPVFEFIPINVVCGDDGRITWEFSDSDNRFIFKILDIENYETAMTKALKSLICRLP